MATVVFFAPYPVEDGGTGSAARPGKMLSAFRELGHEVLDITGTGAQRRKKLKALARRIDGGQRIDCAYGENSTMPWALTESHHLPFHADVELSLLRLFARHRIPTGVFYRDVYWRFPAYDTSVPRVIGWGTKTLYHLEALGLRRAGVRLYLPSEKMAPYVPHIPSARMRALPPGGRVLNAPHTQEPGKIRLLYVGNISSYYRVHALFEAVASVDGVELVFCTPERSWRAVESEYSGWVGRSISVVHASGADLLPLFQQADVCSLLVEPAEYRDFAAPIKLFEYIGYGKPVLASEGTHAATLIDGALGWTVEYSADSIASTLVRLRDNPHEVSSMRCAVEAGRERHTWAARAAYVLDDLASLRD